MAKKKTHGGVRKGAGRKSGPEGPTMRVGVTVPKSLMAELDAVVAKKNLNRSKAITEAIRAYIKRLKK